SRSSTLSLHDALPIFEVFRTARRLEYNAVAWCRLQQGAPKRRHPTDVVTVEIDFVGAHDAHHSLRSRGIGVAHGRSEECPRRPRSEEHTSELQSRSDL